MNTPKQFTQHHNWRKYTLTLDETTGEVVAYAVEVNARGKAPATRPLWYKGSGKPMPKGLKDVMNSPGCLEAIARAMNW